MTYGEYACPFITKLSINAELKEYFNKEVKAEIKAQTNDIRQEIVLLKQTSRQRSRASTNNFQPWIGVWTLLLYPIHWLATKLAILGGSDQTEEITHLKERIERLEKRVEGQDTLNYCTKHEVTPVYLWFTAYILHVSPKFHYNAQVHTPHVTMQ